MARAIDLNADMGEYADEESAANEAALMPLVTSCSIACGGHAGDEVTMRRTAHLAKTHKIGVGAHPAYPDRDGFGRRSIEIDDDVLEQSIRKQIDALRQILRAEEIELRHVKPHGALYNDAAKNDRLARLILRAAAGTTIVGQPGSAMERAAKEAGAPFIAEGFVDRLYRADGRLTPRSEPGAVIVDIAARAAQAAAIACGTTFAASDGEIAITADTLCIHSDSPGAVETAKATRAALAAADIAVAPFLINKR